MHTHILPAQRSTHTHIMYAELGTCYDLLVVCALEPRHDSSVVFDVVWSRDVLAIQLCIIDWLQWRAKTTLADWPAATSNSRKQVYVFVHGDDILPNTCT